jgi:hypothetical protein
MIDVCHGVYSFDDSDVSTTTGQVLNERARKPGVKLRAPGPRYRLASAATSRSIRVLESVRRSCTRS